MSARARILLLAALGAALVALALAVLLGGGGSSHSPATPGGALVAGSAAASGSGFDGAALPGGGRPRDFTLTDQSGRMVSLSEFRGRVTVLTFLYSACGATCILIAQQIRGALDELPHRVPVLIVSADPAADSPARVGRFLARVSLTGRVHYLTGPIGSLRAIWRAYGVVPAGSGRSFFERSASVLLLDRSGRARVLFQSEQLTPEALSHDIRKLS
jgi:cytochrome oxidase Cu insertion factor (SCO1/SenC/PrrC family)